MSIPTLKPSGGSSIPSLSGSRPSKTTYLSPSSAPKSVAVRRRPAAQSGGIPRLRGLSPDAARAIALNKRVNRGIARVDQRVNPPQQDGGIIGSITGAITAPFRITGTALSNAVGEAKQIIPGSSRLAYEVVKNTGQALTGNGDAAGRLVKIGDAIVTGIGNDVTHLAGPIIHGNPGELARRVVKEPIRTLGTAAMLYGAAGEGVRLASKGAEVAARGVGAARAAERARAFASKRTVARPGEAVPRRYRAPEVIHAPTHDRYGREAAPNTQSVVIRPRRPRSANPITRELQRAVNDRVVNAVREAAGRVNIRGRNGRNINPFSHVARWERIGAKQARNAGTDFAAQFENNFLQGTQTFQKIVRSLPAKTGSEANARAASFAAALRSMGLNNLGKTHTSRTWGRDELIRLYTEARTKTQNPLHARDIEKNIATLKSIPDHWLDPATAPKVINDLTNESIKILNKSTELKVATGLLKPETAAASGRRSQMAVAGALPDFRAYQDAQRAQQEAAAQAVELHGRAQGITDKITRIKAKAKASGRPLTAGQKQVVKDWTSEANRLRSDANKAARAAARNEAAATALHTKIGQTIDWEMSPGSYFPHVRTPEPGIKNRGRLTMRPVSGESARMTAAAEHVNKGIILRDGTAAFGPDVTLAAFRNALDLYGRQQAVEALVTKFVVKDSNGVPITNEAAVKLAEGSSDLYVARSKQQLIRTLASNDKSEMAKELLASIKESNGDTKYLIPRSIEKGWKQALGSRRNLLDQLNAYWKAGVLALTPRWYVQNLIGMTAQFLLGAGLDLQAMRMAASKDYRASVIAEIEGHGLASDLGEFARRDAGKEARGRIRRVIDFGYKWNAKFESIPRRAMYFHAVKKRLTEEEMLTYGSSSAGLSQAWLDVANAAKRGEAWASDLIDQVTLETERFMGNYARYNQFERTVLRRAFPFYGWMRAIHRLAFALPVKYPKRAALLAAGSRLAYQMYSDNESTLLDPIAGIVIGKDKFLGTSLTNPVESLRQSVDAGAAIGQDLARGEVGKIPAAVIQQVYPQLNPLLTAIPTAALNLTPLGTPLKYGYGTDVFTDPQTGRTYAIDPTTGDVVDAHPQTGWEQIVGRNFPIYNTAKRVIAGGTPTENASLGDLLAWRLGGSPAKEAPNLVQAAKPGGQALTKGWLYDLTNMTLGLPVYDYSAKGALIQSIRNDQSKLRAYKGYLKQRMKQQALYSKLGIR